MSVLADLRNLSSKEYYKNALRIRKELELYLTRDFAKKALKHNISTVTYTPTLTIQIKSEMK